MRIFRKIHAKKAQEQKQREVSVAIKAYNEALIALGEAAGTIGRVAKEYGMTTPTIENAVDKMQEIARTALLTEEDFEKGGTANGKGKRD